MVGVLAYPGHAERRLTAPWARISWWYRAFVIPLPFCELALHGVSSYTGATVHGVRMHGGEFWVHALGEGTSV
jgi:hypothetical protein